MGNYAEYGIAPQRVRKKLDALSPAVRESVGRLLWAFGETLDAYPDRIREEQDGTFLYEHDNPMIRVQFTVNRDTQKITLSDVGVREFAPKVSVFVCYAHKDRKWLQELDPYFKTLKVYSQVEHRDDRLLEPGDPFRERLVAFIRDSHISLLLVSQDFIASDFINDVELPLIREKHAQLKQQVMWIPVAHTYLPDGCFLCEIEAAFKPPEPLDGLRPNRRKEIYSLLCEKLVTAAKKAAVNHA